MATRRARFPLLITFLGLGMLLGSEGIGGIYFDDAGRRHGLTTAARPFYHPPVEVAAIRALGGELLEHEVGRNDAIVGSFIRDLDIPPDAIVMLIVRDDTGIPPRGTTAVAAGDRLYILVRGEPRTTVEDTIRRWEQGLTAGQRG